MAGLIEDLKKDHATIENVLGQVKDLGIGSSKGQTTLLAARQGLLAHLSKEDAQLYPALRKAAERDEKLRRTLDVFAADMQEISKTALDFFQKYASGGSGLEFAKDFGKLVAALKQRIHKEENLLYVEYEKIGNS